MALVNWSDQYSVGVSRMDTHHRQLFEIINKLHVTMKEGNVKQTISIIINELIDYTQYHFCEEEALLEEIHYPALSTQKQAHKHFVSQLETLRQEINEKQNALTAIKVSKVATDWLKNHILKMDKKYQEYMIANNIHQE